MAKKILIFILLLTMASGLLCGCESQNAGTKEISIDSDSKYGSIYEISECLDDEQYDEYMNDDCALFCRLLDFRHRLTDSAEFMFCAFAENFIEIIDKEVPETCIVNHNTEYEADSKYVIDGDSITATEAIQISEDFFTLFPAEIAAGRSFESSDFSDDADFIPVILGSDYRDFFDLGDTFEGYYICERRMFTVIGFTAPGEEFYLRSNNRMVAYDNYIIMPFENIAEDSFSARAILLQQICGFIVPQNSLNSALQTIREYLTDAGLEGWTDAIVLSEKSLQDKISPKR